MADLSAVVDMKGYKEPMNRVTGDWWLRTKPLQDILRVETDRLTNKLPKGRALHVVRQRVARVGTTEDTREPVSLMHSVSSAPCIRKSLESTHGDMRPTPFHHSEQTTAVFKGKVLNQCGENSAQSPSD